LNGLDDADRAAKIIQNALGIESDEVANAGLTITSGPRRSNSFWGRGAVEWSSLRIASASPCNDLKKEARGPNRL
jgi:hypothetical protein